MSNQNAEIARNFLGSIDRNDWDELRRIITDDFVMEFPGQPNLDKESFVQFCVGWFAAFPDLTHNIQETVCEDDRVAIRIIVRGTQLGDFMGLPASGRTVAMNSLGIARVRDGRVAGLWAQPDVMGMMQQLGAVPEPTTA
jgi:C-1 hydroxylase